MFHYYILALSLLILASIPHVKPQPNPPIILSKLVLQWPNSVCKVTTHRVCTHPIPQEFSVHGLWPPNTCTRNPRKLIPAYEFMAFPFRNDLDKYWPDLFGNNISFWNHEWEKHGWCHYSKAEQYFGETIRLVKEVETNLGGSLISVFIAAGLNPGSRSYDPGLFSKQIYTISKIVTEVRCKYGPNNRAQVNEIVFCLIQTAGSNTYHLYNCSSPARGTNWSNYPYSQNCQVLPRGTLFPK